ncbi:hypothetical protein KCP76_15055 [Salmonella enterica subsp. enterica serovar Weltevreden]|nr:hypothetical protein KCP76_15055 [Salmonella enterica subsp. enterica serovar Weltevreden]
MKVQWATMSSRLMYRRGSGPRLLPQRPRPHGGSCRHPAAVSSRAQTQGVRCTFRNSAVTGKEPKRRAYRHLSG